MPNGDDAAVFTVPSEYASVVATDTLVAGRHFFPDAEAADVGYKALAVNLSDLAAMGAKPRFALLALTLPEVNDHWLSDFSAGFYALADRFEVQLIGGDTTQGALTISVTVIGEVPADRVLTRSGAQPSDGIYVTGDIGRAGLALSVLRGEIDIAEPELSALLPRLHRPEPRVAVGMALRDMASACIDVSDGLVADLGHILESSHVGAELQLTHIPVHELVRRHWTARGELTSPLSAGDDYELCFTVPSANESLLADRLADSAVPVTRIGTVTDNAGVARWLAADGSMVPLTATGFDHFG